MKNSILIRLSILMLFLTYVCPTSRAQHPYIPIPEDSAFWISVEEYWHEDDPSWQGGHTFSYLVNYTDGQDTVVNGVRYFCYFLDVPPLIHYGNTSVMQADWFRQDTIAKTVWEVWVKADFVTGNPKERLLYDFSLQKGDTLTDTTQWIFHRWLPYKFWVDDVDSIYFPDGTWRYRWFIKSNFGPDWGRPAAEVVQIEGMGYTTDFRQDPLFFYEPVIGYTYQVTCFRHNDLWLYTTSNPWNADCDTLIDHNILDDLGIHDPPVTELNLPLLYPNPAVTGGRLTLNSLAGPPGEKHTIIAYSITGKLVLKKTIMPGQTLMLPGLSPGLYFFMVENEKQKAVCKQKIRIQ